MEKIHLYCNTNKDVKIIQTEKSKMEEKGNLLGIKD
jgi:hypothetical protein